MRKTSCAGGFFALLLAQQVSLAAPEPSMQIKSANGSNKAAGMKVLVGDPIKTGKSGVVTGDFAWGGVKSFTLFPSSTFELSVYGNRAGGAHFSQFSLTGEGLIEVQTTNPGSEVKLCLKNRLGRTGCGTLKSTVRTAPVEDGSQVVGVVEGNVLFQGEEGEPVEIETNQYSILGKDGNFTPARTVVRATGYSLLPIGRSKTIGVFKTDPGWRFCNGGTVSTTAIGARVCVVSPLRSK